MDEGNWKYGFATTKIKLSSKNENFGKLIFTMSLAVLPIFKDFSDESGGDNNMFFKKNTAWWNLPIFRRSE